MARRRESGVGGQKSERVPQTADSRLPTSDTGLLEVPYPLLEGLLVFLEGLRGPNEGHVVLPVLRLENHVELAVVGHLGDLRVRIERSAFLQVRAGDVLVDRVHPAELDLLDLDRIFRLDARGDLELLLLSRQVVLHAAGVAAEEE